MHLALLVILAAATFTPSSVAQRVSKYVPVEVAPSTVLQLSGRYVDAAAAVTERTGPALSGTELHLFPDGTYIHAEWADILPLTIDDLGTWRLKNGVIRLQSASTVTWQVRRERELIGVRRRGHREVLLVSPRQLRYFEEHVHDSPNDPEFMLLITTLAVGERYGPTKAAAARKHLLDTAWNPEFYRGRRRPSK